MRPRPARLPLSLVAALLVAASPVLLAGCAHPTTDQARSTGAVRPAPGAASGAASGGALPAETAPTKPFAVGVRQVRFARGDRPLPTTIWYPATGPAGGSARGGAAPAPGRFPLVVFSHGLGGLPESYAPLTTRWAAAGFVVAAPAYPKTNAHVAHPQVLDIASQPADASAVIDGVLALDANAGDPLAGHVDPQRVGAAGHSAGGYTTVGMFTSGRDPRLRAGIVIAGGLLGGAYQGAPAPLLFVHGDKDATVSYAVGRSAYDNLPWPKAFLTLIGAGHLGYLGPGDRPFDAAVRTTVDFLRWSLYGDPAAKSRLPGDATVSGVCRLDLTL